MKCDGGQGLKGRYYNTVLRGSCERCFGRMYSTAPTSASWALVKTKGRLAGRYYNTV